MTALDVTRQGRSEADCSPEIYDSVTFRIDCLDCDYDPGDEQRTRFTLRSSTVAVESGGWGRIKSLYR
jgi:hypothetical protein